MYIKTVIGNQGGAHHLTESEIMTKCIGSSFIFRAVDDGHSAPRNGVPTVINRNEFDGFAIIPQTVLDRMNL